MPRYIDADALVDVLHKRSDELQDEHNIHLSGALLGAICFVYNSPTADVAPVRHGKWIPKDVMVRCPDAKNYICSVCGKDNHKYKYCPDCGALME